MSNSTNESKPQSNNGFGGKLRSARTSRGYSLDAVAKELNILKRYVQALEEENFAALPPFAYARGFIINYAKFLELDSNEFANAFDAVYPDDMRPKSVSSPLTPMGTLHRGRASVRINPWLIAGVIGLIVLGVVLLKIISNATNKEENIEQIPQTQTLTPSEQAQGAAIGGSGSAVNLPAPPVNEPVPAGQGVIDIWSKGDVNIKITDKNDNVLMQGLQSLGGYKLQGETPIKVEIDNPAQVDVKFNNTPVRLGEHTQNGKASLTLQ
ncbi:helix-turn-helix domain-containing protein [Moraxella sp. VT-16-12]|uniref:helix-turn-helix domain-containing protein n=1 Tax=Moraxella sp. VT-16-12 TaxID=2014877 RepID=UPI000B7CE12C|nr:helix-turn-helix domain-containing protein [Moraxella sp. VT-16-12]TWV84061.1 DUF4115 domain-containing protein [Moraxella sp. VT-16-12]